VEPEPEPEPSQTGPKNSYEETLLYRDQPALKEALEQLQQME
jgi:hypothetical protein